MVSQLKKFDHTKVDNKLKMSYFGESFKHLKAMRGDVTIAEVIDGMSEDNCCASCIGKYQGTLINFEDGTKGLIDSHDILMYLLDESRSF